MIPSWMELQEFMMEDFETLLKIFTCQKKRNNHPDKFNTESPKFFGK